MRQEDIETQTGLTAMTFEQLLARANETKPNALFHIWVEYAGGKRGYANSYETKAKALAMFRVYENQGMGPTIYDRDGNDVDL